MRLMFICPIKVNGSMLFKVLMIGIIIVVLVICGFAAFGVWRATNMVSDDIPSSEVQVLTNQNYATILDTVHNNIDAYVGQRIQFSGFVYRVYDLNNEQFVLGRNMIISSDFQTVVVGFLCHYKDAISYADQTWVEIEGTITKGDYHGDMPILEITSIQKIEKPNDEYVYPPDENYIPTSAIL